MTFLTPADYNRKIREDILNQIIDNDPDILDTAETGAAAIINDMLSGRYDITTEFEKTEADRHQNLLLWMLNISAYLIYDRIPDNEVPERIVKDYDDTISTLQKIAAGKMPTTLTSISVDGKSKRVFRMGSNTKKSHSML